MRYSQRSEAFKSKLWGGLVDSLGGRGFVQNDGRYFECCKTTPRREVRVTAYDRHIELYVREYPLAEGWFLRKVPWTKKHVDLLKESCTWW